METLRIDILNPKAKALLKALAELKLIRIKKDQVKSELRELLDSFRNDEDNVPTMDEIASEVEAVRKARYEKH